MGAVEKDFEFLDLGGNQKLKLIKSLKEAWGICGETAEVGLKGGNVF